MRKSNFAPGFGSPIAVRLMQRVAFAAFVLFLPSAVQAVDPDFASFCNRYASDAVDQATKNQQMKCGFEGPRWTTNREDHFNWCIGQDGVYAPPTIEGESRIAELQKCAAEANKPVKKLGKRLPGTSTTSTLPQTTPEHPCNVKKDSVVYDKPDGSEIGELAAKTQGVFLLAKQGDNYFNVKWPAGEGWVFSGPGYEDAIECP